MPTFIDESMVATSEVHVNQVALELVSQQEGPVPVEVRTLHDFEIALIERGISSLSNVIDDMSDKSLYEIGFQMMNENTLALIQEMRSAETEISWQKPLENALSWLHRVKDFACKYTFLEMIQPVLDHHETSVRQLFGIHQTHQVLTEDVYCAVLDAFQTRLFGQGLRRANRSVSVRFGYCRLKCSVNRQVIVIRDSCKQCGGLCVPCLVRWVRQQLYEQKQRVVCLDCNNVFTSREVCLLLGKDTDEQLQQVLSDLRNSEDKTCPVCLLVTEKPKVTKNAVSIICDCLCSLCTVSQSDLLITCHKCSTIWCYQCQTVGHDNSSCRDNKYEHCLLPAWCERKTTFPPIKLANVNSIHLKQIRPRKCPVCRSLVNEVNDNGEMKCRCCHTTFCYWCKTVTDTCCCDISRTERESSKEGLPVARRYKCVGVGRRVRASRIGFVLSRKLYGTHSSKWSVYGCTRTFLPNRPVIRKLLRAFIFCLISLICWPIILLITAVLLILSPILLIFILTFGVTACCIIAKRRRAILERRAQMDELRHNRPDA